MSVFDLHISDVLERNRISRELLALYTHRIFAQAGVAVAGVFTVIFVYQHFSNSLWAVLYTYGALYLSVALMTPFSARLLSSLGTRTMLLLSLPCMAVGAAVLYCMNAYGDLEFFAAGWGIVAFVVSAVLFKALYWVPYHVDMSQLLDRSHRGFQLALLENSADVNIAAMPFWGGLIVASLGFGWLYLFAITLLLIACIPLVRVSNRYETYEWTYRQTLRQLLARHNRPLLFTYLGDGVQSGVQLVVWPLFVFMLLDGEFIALGAVAALTLFAVIFLRFLTGNFFDHGRKQQVLAWGAMLVSSGWILRMFAATPFSVVAIDTYHGFGQVVNRISVEAISYEQAADNGRFVDEFTVLKEMSVNLGRMLALAFVGVFVWSGGEYVGFAAGLLFASAAALATTRIARQSLIGA